MAQGYNDPANVSGSGAVASGIGSQIRTDKYEKKALMEARKEQYFMPLSNSVNLPKNMGKKIKKFHYLPILDDANINDQGIDAAGAVAVGFDVTIAVTSPSISSEPGSAANTAYFVGNGNSAGNALTAAEAVAFAWAKSTVSVGGLAATEANYADWKTAVDSGSVTVVVENAAVPQGGNLYGSSKDPGVIAGKLPSLTENGGRVNRVGHKRIDIEGSIEKQGFFDEYTQESLDFDSDEDLLMHITREMVNAATENTEDKLQIDLLNSAGVVRYAGDATSTATVEATDVVSYGDLIRLSIELDNNRTPKQTKMFTGTRMVDTKTVAACRVLFVGSELIPTLKAMQDNFNNAAFIPVQHYAGGGTTVNGEIGTIDNFRIVVVPEMMSYAAGGATAGAQTTAYETGGKIDVFPMLCVGSEAFSTIGFQTDGQTVKFKITHKKPGEATADRNDPYGETGFMSIKWYYGFLLERPERIAKILTAATV
mgnify:FL=1|tara:strand:- start:876 stop:2321 length:1446 start_codon:yes stop_codon:yes gene_type:complete